MDFNINDSLGCSVTLRDNEQLLIGIVYRSPSSSDKKMVDYFLPLEVLMNSMTLMFYLMVISMFRTLTGRTQITWEVNHPLLLVYLMPPMMLIFFNT